jgi:hypothetical protein
MRSEEGVLDGANDGVALAGKARLATRARPLAAARRVVLGFRIADVLS